MKIKVSGLVKHLNLDIEDIERVSVLTWHVNRKKQRMVIQAMINGIATSIGRFLLNYAGPLEVDHKIAKAYCESEELNRRFKECQPEH